jgi:hypothetical protein
VSLAENEVRISLKLPDNLRNFQEFDTVAKIQAAQAWDCNPDQFELKYPAAVFLKPEVTVSAIAPKDAQMLRTQQLAKAKIIGVGFATLLVFTLVWVAITVKQLKNEEIQLLTEISAIQSGQAERKRITNELEVGQKNEAADWTKIQQHLQTDLNPLFGSFEDIQIPQVRLREFNFENSSQTVQVTYELTSLSHLPTLVRHMQKNDGPISWQLKSISQQGQGIQTRWTGKF